jgi:hypothetical protein
MTRTPGPMCQTRNPQDVDDDGTMLRCESPRPGPTSDAGVSTASDLEVISPEPDETCRISQVPEMPQIVAKVRLNNYAGLLVQFDWKLTIEWTGNAYSTKSPLYRQLTFAAKDEVSTWNIDFGTDFYGGDATLEVEAIISEGPSGYKRIPSPKIVFKILGEQPDVATVKAAIGSDPWYLRRMVAAESEIKQFAEDGTPLECGRNDGGIGIFQITSKKFRKPVHAWNWRSNVEEARREMQSHLKEAQHWWDRQMSQFNQWNAQHPTATVKPPEPVKYNDITFSHQPAGTQRPFAEAIAIKMYNGARRHFIFWDNVGPKAQSPSWTVDEGENDYVEHVCAQKP